MGGELKHPPPKKRALVLKSKTFSIYRPMFLFFAKMLFEAIKMKYYYKIGSLDVGNNQYALYKMEQHPAFQKVICFRHFYPSKNEFHQFRYRSLKE